MGASFCFASSSSSSSSLSSLVTSAHPSSSNSDSFYRSGSGYGYGYGKGLGCGDLGPLRGRKRNLPSHRSQCVWVSSSLGSSGEEQKRPSLGSSSSSPQSRLEETTDGVGSSRSSSKGKERRDRAAERLAYLVAAVASSTGITSLAAGAVYYRFSWQLQGGDVSLVEMLGTFSLAFGAAVGMEFWARWAHRALWHESLWSMHKSHHQVRDGPFELNDVFAIINAVPAIALLAYGFFHKGLVPGLCFGAGLGITVFGMAYMFVHDGLVHRRFPVGPIANVPYLQKVAAAHQLHHADKFNGVPFGLFLGPKELEVVGGSEELEKLTKIRKRICEEN